MFFMQISDTLFRLWFMAPWRSHVLIHFKASGRVLLLTELAQSDFMPAKEAQRDPTDEVRAERRVRCKSGTNGQLPSHHEHKRNIYIKLVRQCGPQLYKYYIKCKHISTICLNVHFLKRFVFAAKHLWGEMDFPKRWFVIFWTLNFRFYDHNTNANTPSDVV